MQLSHPLADASDHSARGARTPSPWGLTGKDGLGTMCTEHWRAYVKDVREARMAVTMAEVKTKRLDQDERLAADSPWP